MMRKIFPLSFKGKNMASVIVSTLFYTLLFILFCLVAFIVWLFANNETVTIVVNIIRQFFLLYCASGIVIAVLYAADVIGDKLQNEECKMKNEKKHG